MSPLNYGAQLVTRAEWGAREARSIERLASGTVTSHWEGPQMGDFPHSICAEKVRGIQDFHMDSRGWNDIAYNAVACPHGYVFEGRGVGVRSAANGTTAGNNGAYAVCFLGGEGDPFTEAARRGMKAAGDWLTFAGSTRNGHRDWKATECPGDEIYQWTHSGQPVTWAPTDPTPAPMEDDMYLLYHENGTFWQIGPGKVAIQISADAYNRLGGNSPQGLDAYALEAADCDAIIGALNNV